MLQIKQINENISYIKACNEPLSADVGIIKGNKYTWLFDVGASEESAQYINEIEGPKAIVISHFHQDHMTNLSKIKYEKLYVGDFTYKKTSDGIVVTEDILIDDGVKLLIKPIPSSHSKGSVILQVDDQYVFMGDSAYCSMIEGKPCYNAGLLLDEIRELKKLQSTYALISHATVFVKKRATLIKGLEYIYNGREGNKPYIQVYE